MNEPEKTNKTNGDLLMDAMEFIDDDELVEITPKSIRMRKKILGTEARKKLAARLK